MPYLTEERKQYLDTGGKLETPGDLTYSLTRTLLRNDPDYIRQGLAACVDVYIMDLGHAPRYADYAVILGCLESTRREWLRRVPFAGRRGIGAALIRTFTDEFYRDVVAPYEDTKIQENGDVYL